MTIDKTFHGDLTGTSAGKLIELDLAEDTSDTDIEAMCRKLLANTVIESFRVEIANIDTSRVLRVDPITVRIGDTRLPATPGNSLRCAGGRTGRTGRGTRRATASGWISSP